MNRKFFDWAAVLGLFVAFALPGALRAEGVSALEAQAVMAKTGEMSCPKPGEQKINMAQTSPSDCCKGQKGVCGCRAGKIICCDGSASTQPGCTCHGEDGFLQ